MTHHHRAPRATSRTAALALLALSLALALTLSLAACSDRPSGLYIEQNGSGKLEFKGSNVYVTVLGVTVVSKYELDGEHIIIRGGGGSQVYTRRGDSIEGARGTTFIKHTAPPVTESP